MKKRITKTRLHPTGVPIKPAPARTSRASSCIFVGRDCRIAAARNGKPKG
jgi:hypothetical protein